MIRKLTSHALLPWMIGLVAIIPVCLPFFRTELFKPHDFTHLARIAELSDTIESGAFPPRWSENFGFGYGMPLFSFYAPLPYYFGALLHLIGLSISTSVILLFLVHFYLSFMAMYFLSKEFAGPIFRYLGALLFIYVPYRAVDVYVRGSLGELYGILFITLSLLSLTKLLSKKYNPGWFIVSTLSIAGLILSHNLMMMIGLPMILGYGLLLVILLPQRRKRAFFRLIGAILLGVGISAYFLFPAILEKQHTSVDRLTEEGGDFRQHFVYLRQYISSPFGYGGSIVGPEDGISFEIGKIHLLLSVIAGAGLLFSWKRLPASKYVATFALMAVLLSLFMASFHSEFIWSLLPFVSYLQFPWRFLSIVIIFLPLFIAIGLSSLFPKVKMIFYLSCL
jgi:hypothetical protein